MSIILSIKWMCSKKKKSFYRSRPKPLLQINPHSPGDGTYMHLLANVRRVFQVLLGVFQETSGREAPAGQAPAGTEPTQSFPEVQHPRTGALVCSIEPNVATEPGARLVFTKQLCPHRIASTEAAGRDVIPVLKEDFREVLPVASHAGAFTPPCVTLRTLLNPP